MRKLTHYIGSSIFLFLCLLVLAETFLRFGTDVFKTYSELSGEFGYISPYVPLTESRNLEYSSGNRMLDLRKEFSYSYLANELGFFDKNPEKRVSGKLRILCLGDSFTHGIGAPQDSSWPRALEVNLQQMGIEAEVINAGLQGSDPIYSIDFLENRLFDAYSPDLVLLAINTTDVYEVALRGGSERFVHDSLIQYRPAPWWEPLFASSYLIRGFIYSLGYNAYLIKDSDMRRVEEESLKTIYDRLREWVVKSKQEGKAMRLGLILHPLLGELKSDGETCIQDAFEPQEVEWFMIDMSAAFAIDGRLTPKNSNHYFWPIDKHHNSKGYWLFGELVTKSLINRLPMANDSIANVGK